MTEKRDRGSLWGDEAGGEPFWAGKALPARRRQEAAAPYRPRAATAGQGAPNPPRSAQISPVRPQMAPRAVTSPPPTTTQKAPVRLLTPWAAHGPRDRTILQRGEAVK